MLCPFCRQQMTNYIVNIIGQNEIIEFYISMHVLVPGLVWYDILFHFVFKILI